MSEISLFKQIRCVERELWFRRKVYPKRVAVGSMTQEDANKEIAVMQAVKDTLVELYGGSGQARTDALNQQLGLGIQVENNKNHWSL